MGSLPTLRLLAKPEPGLGFDARLRLGYGMNCFFAAESYLSGASKVNFGLEPVRLPWLRVQLTPSVKVMLRFQFLRVSRYKYIYGGWESTLYSEGKCRVPYRGLRNAVTFNNNGNTGIRVDKQMFWNTFKGMWKPLAELVHRNTLIGMLGLTDKQRTTILKSINALHERKAGVAAGGAANGGIDRRLERMKKRAEIMGTFDDPNIPELDPRTMTREELKQKLYEKIVKKRAQMGINTPEKEKINMDWENKYPAFTDDMRDDKLQQQQKPSPSTPPAFLLGLTSGSHAWNLATYK